MLRRRRFGDDRLVLSVPEVADLLLVSRESVRNWCKRGDLEHVRVGVHRNFRIPLRAVAAYLVQHPEAANPDVIGADESA